MDTRGTRTLIAQYAQRLHQQQVAGIQLDSDRKLDGLQHEEALAHARFLCGQALKIIAKDGHADRLPFYLAAIQLFLSLGGWYTLEELEGHLTKGYPDSDG